MECKTFYFNALRTCCYVVYDTTGNCVIIDPGCFGENEEQRLAHYLRDNQLTPKFIVNTHAHFDHLMGLRFLMNQYNIPFHLHPLEEQNLKRASDYARLFGFHMIQPECEYIPLEDGKHLHSANRNSKCFTHPDTVREAYVCTTNKTTAYLPETFCLQEVLDVRTFPGEITTCWKNPFPKKSSPYRNKLSFCRDTDRLPSCQKNWHKILTCNIFAKDHVSELHTHRRRPGE